jgi:hypothetical protein
MAMNYKDFHGFNYNIRVIPNGRYTEGILN